MKRPRPIQLLLAIASLVSLPIGSGAEPAATTTTGRTYAERLTEAGGITRFAVICPGLARGGEPDDAGIRYLRDRGYKTVVSFLTNSAESLEVVHSGMRYINIPMRSGPFSAQPPTEEQVSRFLSVVGDSTLFPIFIHCHAGKDRTGAMSAIYRMQVCGWSKDDAIGEMKSFGFAGRYKRLFSYVEDYSVRPPASAVAESKVVAGNAALGQDSKVSAPNEVPASAPGR